MTEKEQQIKNSIIYLLPSIVGNLLPFITLPIFTRILTPGDYGILALAQIYGSFIAGVAHFGMTNAYERNYFQYRHEPEKSAQLFYSTLFFVLSNFLVLAGLTFLFKDVFAEFIIGSTEYGYVLFWTVCAKFPGLISAYYVSYLKNSENARYVVAYLIATTLINFVLSLLFVAHLQTGIIGIIYAQLISGLAPLMVLGYKFAVSYLPLCLPNRIIFVDTLKVGLPLTPRIFIGVLDNQFSKYMIGLLESLGGVGVYSIGEKVSNIVFVFMTAIQNVYSPQVYKRMFDMPDEGGAAIGRYLTPFAYISAFAALLIALLSEEVIFLLTPPSYYGAIDIIGVLSMYYGLMFIGKIIGPQLIFAKKTYISSLLSVVSLALTIGLNIPFIMKWGALGAAWATLLGSALLNIIAFFVAQHFYEIKWEYSRIGAIFFIFCTSTILLILLRDIGVVYPLRLLTKIICLFVYLAFGAKIDLINEENYLLIKGIVTGNLQKVFWHA